MQESSNFTTPHAWVDGERFPRCARAAATGALALRVMAESHNTQRALPAVGPAAALLHCLLTYLLSYSITQIITLILLAGP